MEYGKAFRKMRKAKGYKIRELARYTQRNPELKSFTHSAISKFEIGETKSVSFHTLSALINLINVPMSEFMLFVEEADSTIEEDFGDIGNAFRWAKNNMDKENPYYQLQNLQIAYKKEARNYPRYNHLFLLCTALIKRLKGKEFESGLTQIEKYLINCDEWYYYEVFLFMNSMFLFSPKEIDRLVETALSKMENYRTLFKETDERAHILVHAILVCLENDAYDLASKYIQQLDGYLGESYYIFEKIQVRYLKGIHQILEGNIEEGIRKAEKAIEYMKEFKIKNQDVQFGNYLEKTLSSINQEKSV